MSIDNCRFTIVDCSATLLLLLLPLFLLFFLSASIYAQSKDDSPVFKKYRPPVLPPLVEPSDPIYQIWQTFLVTRKANAGDVLAQHELGLRYLFGRGAAADTEKAAYWTRKAADQNYVPAKFNYAILNYHGWGLPWNPFESYRGFRYCAEHNMPEAQYVLAQFLTENLVIPRDYQAAYRWVKTAADSGYAPAKEALVRLDKQGIGRPGADSARRESNVPNTGLVFLDFPQDSVTVMNDSLFLQEAIQHAGPELRQALGMTKLLETESKTDSATLAAIRLAGEAGSPEALTVMGRSYEKGAGVRKDAVKACAYYVRALRVDSPRAPELLWTLMQEKSTLPSIKAGAGRGDPEAEFSWAGLSALGFDGVLAQGQAYLTGGQAFQMLMKAGDRGFLPALVEAGLCYYSGRWVGQNNEKAVELWKKAAGEGSLDAKVRIMLTSLRIPGDTARHREAVEVLAAAAERGSVLAEVGLGYCYETGTGVPERKAEAAHNYRAASVRGSQDAYRALLRMHDAIRPPEKEYKLND